MEVEKVPKLNVFSGDIEQENCLIMKAINDYPEGYCI